MYLGTHLHDYSPPGGRLPPPEVVRGLREIDPLMELVYVGNGKWLLGKVAYNREKFESASVIYENIQAKLKKAKPGDHDSPWKVFVERAHNRLRERKLYLQGFQPFKGILSDAQLHSGLVEAFRHADWIWKFAWRDYDRKREAREDGTTDLEERQKELVSRFEQIHREVHRSVFRHAVSEPSGVDMKDGQIIREEGARA